MTWNVSKGRKTTTQKQQLIVCLSFNLTADAGWFLKVPCPSRAGWFCRFYKLRKTFSQFYRRHYELVSKFSVGLKPLLHQGLSEPEFYGDLVDKFKKNEGRADFSDQFRKILVRYKLIGYNINIMRQFVCLVFNPITVNNFAPPFNCTPVGRASDSVMAPT